MRNITFRYRILSGQPYLFPMCDLQLLGPRGRANLVALVDTGATYSLFPASAARDVGIVLPLAPNQNVQYGDSLGFGRRVRADILLGSRQMRVPVVFVERLAFRFALLGRLGVVARFNSLTFVERSDRPWTAFAW